MSAESTDEKVKEFLGKSDEELITKISDGVITTPQKESVIASAILQKRLSDNISELNKSTDSYNKVLLLFTIILIVVAWMQLVVGVYQLNLLLATLILLFAGALIFFVIFKFKKILPKK